MGHLPVTFLALMLMGCDPDAGKSAPRSDGSAWPSLIATEGCLVGAQDAIDGLGEGTCLAEITGSSTRPLIHSHPQTHSP